MLTTSFLVLILLLTLLLAGIVIIPVFFGAPWHPTSPRTIRQILDFCETQPGEIIYDLGSGDGRVLITAAREYGLVGVGIEIDPLKAWFSRQRVRWARLTDRIRIFRGNVHNHDFSDADILFIYLSHDAVDRLFPALIDKLKPTVKIVTYRFCLRATPTKVNSDKTIFLYQLNKGTRLNGYS